MDPLPSSTLKNNALGRKIALRISLLGLKIPFLSSSCLFFCSATFVTVVYGNQEIYLKIQSSSCIIFNQLQELRFAIPVTT